MSYEDDINIIQMQTSETNSEIIKEIYEKHNKDMVKTIMEVSRLQESQRDKKVTDPVFDEIRKIVDEKERLYHQTMQTYLSTSN